MMGTLTTEPHVISRVLSKLLISEKEYSFVKSQYELYKVNKITNKEFWKRIEVPNPIESEAKFLNRIKLREDVVETLVQLRKDNFKLAILSNAPKEWGHYLSKRFSFNNYFDEIVFSGDYGVKKPNPEIYQLLLTKFPDSEKKVIYYIDDELGDLETGKDQNMRTIWLKIEEEDCAYKPDYTINNLIQIKDIVK